MSTAQSRQPVTTHPGQHPGGSAPSASVASMCCMPNHWSEEYPSRVLEVLPSQDASHASMASGRLGYAGRTAALARFPSLYRPCVLCQPGVRHAPQIGPSFATMDERKCTGSRFWRVAVLWILQTPPRVRLEAGTVWAARRMSSRGAIPASAARPFREAHAILTILAPLFNGACHLWSPTDGHTSHVLKSANSGVL
ncbi:uncharacterized protein B0I36DRAFT_319919 [Microdochium trichocladiopsis]|uniref:Uncharacterized protein n=1 Tax=Microdochium trichocladiopsis TaxID=1682393 RepID=A0A9P9BP34_9PEZI|nr:uncharacterized protein B0I36DRAFT_319919 [Microdochium trichocladiopsis]KAH7032724.1 hypothetical protein B0I36DRAFT_319919 [Microdochium trichocladiopsis]